MNAPAIAAKETARVVLEGAKRSHDLSGVDLDARKVFVGRVLKAVVKSPFLKPRTWPAAVVVVREGVARVTSRADHAHFLRANDLAVSARECTSRKVPRDSILVWIEVDDHDLGAAGFVVLSLIAEGHALWPRD